MLPKWERLNFVRCTIQMIYTFRFNTVDKFRFYFLSVGSYTTSTPYNLQFVHMAIEKIIKYMLN